MADKKEIRQQIKLRRSKIDMSSWKTKTDIITNCVIHLRCFLEASDIYCYINFGKETGTYGIIREAWRLGKNVWAPKVSGDNMEFYILTSFEELSKGAYGIPEPADAVPSKGDKGLMIMPGVAFDKERNRIGYGKGYYDRYLKTHPLLRTAAIAFDMQIVNKIEAEEQDIKPEMLVTESLYISDGKYR